MVKKFKNGILLCGHPNFDPFVSFECGQCFRFEKESDSRYRFVARGRGLTVERMGNDWFFDGVTEEEFRTVWWDYFDLERDYDGVIRGFSHNEVISRAAHASAGIRIFRQDPWETLISFIISQNNNIPRIKKIIDSLCTLLGERASDGTFLFPTPDAICEAGTEGLAPIKSGFRAKYIFDAAEKVKSGQLSLESVAKGTYEQGLAALKTVKGVGDKVANCVLLFGFGFLDAFPVDVWVKKVIDKYFDGSFDPTSLGGYAGIAQQYLFYYERSILTEEEKK